MLSFSKIKKFPTFIINLKSRIDRKEYMKNEITGVTWIVPRFVEAFESIFGAEGCLQSHLRVLELGTKIKTKSFLVLEDDVKLKSKFLTKDLEYSVNFFENNDYDILYLGWTNIKRSKDFRYSTEVTSCVGTFAMVIKVESILLIEEVIKTFPSLPIDLRLSSGLENGMISAIALKDQLILHENIFSSDIF